MKKNNSYTILVLLMLFTLSIANAQYVTIGKGKDSEGNKRAVKDEGFTSDFHEKHNKEIVFMKKPIESADFTEADIVTTHTYGEDLYFRTFLARSLVNEIVIYKKPITVFYDDVQYKMEITMDGKYTSHSWIDGSFFEKKGTEKRTTWYGLFYMAEEDKYRYAEAGLEEFAFAHGDKVTAGAHTFEFKLYPAYGGWSDGEIMNELNEEEVKPMASGKLTINFKKPLLDPNDPKICLPTPKFSDKELEEAMLEAFRDTGWKQTPLKSVIQSDFRIQRNKYTGVVERKVMDGIVGYKNKDGICKYQTYSFAKEHDGSDFNGKLELYGINSTYQVPCGCLE